MEGEREGEKETDIEEGENGGGEGCRGRERREGESCTPKF